MAIPTDFMYLSGILISMIAPQRRPGDRRRDPAHLIGTLPHEGA
jgi:hypothetical protein